MNIIARKKLNTYNDFTLDFTEVNTEYPLGNYKRNRLTNLPIDPTEKFNQIIQHRVTLLGDIVNAEDNAENFNTLLTKADVFLIKSEDGDIFVSIVIKG